jgi:cyclopropane-fatty-acyl-phospholipid synthase
MTSGVAGRLAGLARGALGMDLPVRVRAWDGSEAGPADGPVLVLRNRRALRRLLWAPGELGLARAYVTGDLDVEGDLADGFRRAWRAARGRPSTAAAFGARDLVKAGAVALRSGAVGPPPKPPACEARLAGRVHTRGRDRAAISHHYDLSNDFYSLLLDPHMAYSSAYFTNPGQNLHDAQTAKLDLICRKLGLQPGMRLLDVGCGWGSLILYAAQHYGVHATGITLSAEQRAFVAGRVADRRLLEHVDVRLQDYRELGELLYTAGAFDAVSSVEMGEHVGEQHYPLYAAIMFDALKPGGRLLLQQMSRRLDTAPGGGVFIERYIAPDMHMRPLWQTLRYVSDAGFEVLGVEAMREHYVRTVEHWLDTFERRYDEFVALTGEETARVWRLYLVGGRLAFEEGRMGVDQILGVRPAAAPLR